MTIYLLMESKHIPGNLGRERDREETKVLQAFTNKQLAEEFVTAKQNVYHAAMQQELEEIDIARRIYENPFRENLGTRPNAHIKTKFIWYVKKIELTTDKFTEFVLEGTKDD